MSAIDASVIFSSKEAFRKFAKQFDSSSGQLSMSKSELKCAILYMYGKRPKDEEIDQLVHSICGNNSDDITFTEAEFEKIISTLNDPFSSSIDFEPNSLYDNYKLMFELLEDYENKNQNRKGFISLTDFKSAVKELIPEAQHDNLDEVFYEIDSNRDEKVTLKDFIDLMKTKV